MTALTIVKPMISALVPKEDGQVCICLEDIKTGYPNSDKPLKPDKRKRRYYK